MIRKSSKSNNFKTRNLLDIFADSLSSGLFSSMDEAQNCRAIWYFVSGNKSSIRESASVVQQPKSRYPNLPRARHQIPPSSGDSPPQHRYPRSPGRTESSSTLHTKQSDRATSSNPFPDRRDPRKVPGSPHLHRRPPRRRRASLRGAAPAPRSGTNPGF